MNRRCSRSIRPITPSILPAVLTAGLLLIPILSLGAQSAIASEFECQHRLEDTPGDWTPSELWAWNDVLCIGNPHVNFAQFRDPTPPRNTTDNCLREKTTLSPAFIRRIFTYQPMADVIAFHGMPRIALRCASMTEPLDLTYVRSDLGLHFYEFLFHEGAHFNNGQLSELLFHDSEFRADLDTPRMVLNGSFEVKRTTVTGLLYMPKMNISGSVELTDTDIYGLHTRRMDNRAIVNARSSIIDGDWTTTRVTVGQPEVSDRPRNYTEDSYFYLFRDGTVYDELKPSMRTMDLSATVISGSFNSWGLTIHGNLIADGAHVRDMRLLFDSSIDPPQSASIYGTLEMHGAHIDDSARIEGVDILGGIRAGTSSVGGKLLVKEQPVIHRGETTMLGSYPVFIGDEMTVGADVEFDYYDYNWIVIDLSGASVGGSLMIVPYSCREGEPPLEPASVLRLRGADIEGIRDIVRYRDEFGSLAVTDANCLWKSIRADLLGWRYDSSNSDMREILNRDVEWLGEWIRDWEGSHQPLPYLQLAERFVEQGLGQKAKEIRIWEREERLQHLTGAEALWQWILGSTTRFGYEPLWALLWLAGLVVIGMLFILFSNCPWGERWIAKRGLWLKVPFFVAGMLALVALTHVPGASVNARGWWSVGVVLVVGSVWAYGARPMVVKVRSNGEDVRRSTVRSVVRLIPSAVLYSVDRAVPFLSFDSEHVEWFRKPHRLNDVTFLCLYFYAHAITGFALTSLFIAGLTGVLK